MQELIKCKKFMDSYVNKFKGKNESCAHLDSLWIYVCKPVDSCYRWKYKFKKRFCLKPEQHCLFVKWKLHVAALLNSRIVVVYLIVISKPTSFKKSFFVFKFFPLWLQSWGPMKLVIYWLFSCFGSLWSIIDAFVLLYLNFF